MIIPTVGQSWFRTVMLLTTFPPLSLILLTTTLSRPFPAPPPLLRPLLLSNYRARRTLPSQKFEAATASSNARSQRQDFGNGWAILVTFGRVMFLRTFVQYSSPPFSLLRCCYMYRSVKGAVDVQKNISRCFNICNIYNKLLITTFCYIFPFIF